MPPPISIIATPASFSSSVREAFADAIGSRNNEINFIPAFSTQRFRFLMFIDLPIITWNCPSKRFPHIPIGLTPLSLSTEKLFGKT